MSCFYCKSLNTHNSWFLATDTQIRRLTLEIYVFQFSCRLIAAGAKWLTQRHTGYIGEQLIRLGRQGCVAKLEGQGYTKWALHACLAIHPRE